MYYPGGHMMFGTGYMGWTMILFWAVILVMLVLVMRWIFRLTRECSEGSETALDILKKRLASGEIDIAEYNEKKQLL